jgi:hypothetical protein
MLFAIASIATFNKMNPLGLLKTVENDLIHVKKWTDVTFHNGALTGTSPDYGPMTVYVCSFRHCESAPITGEEANKLLAIVDEDSTISYFRIMNGIADSAVQVSKKEFTTKKIK